MLDQRYLQYNKIIHTTGNGFDLNYVINTEFNLHWIRILINLTLGSLLFLW